MRLQERLQLGSEFGVASYHLRGVRAQAVLRGFQVINENLA
jgi:hypothetical protein